MLGSKNYGKEQWTWSKKAEWQSESEYEIWSQTGMVLNSASDMLILYPYLQMRKQILNSYDCKYETWQ